ncbi:hypothetical protein EPUL_006327 [Erysiphe pulchra]|uniref:2EXR domain-containing protein n=1 Tax=Erysiphe pulchra TaxID=225359 RepID=A0A2S4PKD9_9PEZI|nr:hypothetical protein EPUL_006327 [Erysiphe pulchra]
MDCIHQTVPEDCQRYNSGLHCDFRKCPYIHNAAQREETWRRCQEQGKVRGKNMSSADTFPIKWRSQFHEKNIHEDECLSPTAEGYQTSSTKKYSFNTKVIASLISYSYCVRSLSSYSLLEYMNPVNKERKNNTPTTVKDQQNHNKNNFNQPHTFSCLKNRLTSEARVLGSETKSLSEKCDPKVCKISPKISRIKCESTIGVQPSKVDLRQIREELSNWAPERLKWIDSLSKAGRQAYFQDMLKGRNQKSSINTKCETKKQSTTEPKSSAGEQRFQLFSRLPAEIRNQIWEYARQDCTSTCHVLLEIKQEPGDSIIIINGKYETVPNPILDARFRYLYHVPGLFGACRESRSIVKNLYGQPKMIAFNRATQRPYPSGKGTCILNFEQDRVFFISCGTFSQIPDLVKFMKHEERNQIKHLAIPFRDYFHESITVTRSLVHFPNLQTLDLVLGDDTDDLKRIGRNLDYSDFVQKSLLKQHLINDRDSLAEDLEDVIFDEIVNAYGNGNRNWSIPIVRTVLVSKSKARAWKIDGFQWETTSKSVPPRSIEA